MADKTKPKLKTTHTMVLTEEQAKRYMHYACIFRNLLTIAKWHNAKLDITQIDDGKLFMTECSANCRRSIKRVYGEHVVEKKHKKLTEITNFL